MLNPNMTQEDHMRTERRGRAPHIYDSILEAIGNTPLVRLHRSAEGLMPEIYAKVEYTNPGGSTKDRIGCRMVEEAEKAGLLKPGGTIIEATAGNTGLGLALVAAVRGYRCIFVMPDKMSADKIRLLKAYGAEVVITPTAVPPDSPEAYNGVADRLAREIPGAWRPNQFQNMANPKAHYETTGPEIWEQTEGRITAFVAGAGTGGSLSGVGAYLKEKNPAIRIIGADIEGSVLSGDSPKPWKVEGIGEDFVPRTLNAHVIDEWIRVSDAESFLTARRVARLEGMMFGGSTGSAFAAAFKYARRCQPSDVIVVFGTDNGRNYLSKMYDDAWMAENGFLETLPERATLADLLSVLGQVGRLLYLTPEDTLARALEVMNENSVSQLPVMEGGHQVGAVEEITLMRAMHQGMKPSDVGVRAVMARPLLQLGSTTVVDEAYRVLLAGNPAVLVVSREGRPLGIVTRTDLMRYYERVPQQSRSAAPQK